MNNKFSEVDRRPGDYVGVLAADVRHFSKHDDVQQQLIVDRLPEVFAHAAERVNLSPLWWDSVFRAFRGDGYVIGFSADLVSGVVDRFFDSLQTELCLRVRDFRACGIELRLRTSLHLGPAAAFDEQVDSPTGRIMVDANRMADADVVRALLDNSDPEVTFVATVLSHAVMENVVQAGRTVRRPSEFVEAPLRVSSKDYEGKGYLRVPAPSGDLLRHGLLGARLEPPTAEERGPVRWKGTRSVVSNSMTGSANNVVQAGDIHGMGSQFAQNANRGFSVQGKDNFVAGGGVDQSAGDRTCGDA